MVITITHAHLICLWTLFSLLLEKYLTLINLLVIRLNDEQLNSYINCYNKDILDWFIKLPTNPYKLKKNYYRLPCTVLRETSNLWVFENYFKDQLFLVKIFLCVNKNLLWYKMTQTSDEWPFGLLSVAFPDKDVFVVLTLIKYSIRNFFVSCKYKLTTLI